MYNNSYKTLLIFLTSLSLLFSCQTREVETKEKNNAEEIIIPSATEVIKMRGDTLIALCYSGTASYFIHNGRVLGYDYELLHKFAEHQGYHVRIKRVENLDSIFHYLTTGQGDLIAYAMTVSNAHRENVNFTQRLYHAPQCLIQKKPEQWEEMLPHQISNRLTRNVLDIAQTPIYVGKDSPQHAYLYELGDDIGDSLNIIPVAGIKSEFNLLEMVAKGKIPYTISDLDVASIYAAYNDDIDCETRISMPQKKAWAVRQNSPLLLKQLNTWITHYKRYKEYYFIYDKYFNNPSTYKKIALSDKTSRTGILSDYDTIIQAEAKSISWDWRLIAAQIYQESRFNQDQESWMGAVGLMQVLPETAQMHGFINLDHVTTNIRTGITHLKYIEENFAHFDDDNRIKFTLAAYNVGLGHIFDAQRLATYLGKDSSIWDGNVAEALLLKSQEKYYLLPACRNGYCRGAEPYKYVNEIMERYNDYCQLIPK